MPLVALTELIAQTPVPFRRDLSIHPYNTAVLNTPRGLDVVYRQSGLVPIPPLDVPKKNLTDRLMAAFDLYTDRVQISVGSSPMLTRTIPRDKVLTFIINPHDERTFDLDRDNVCLHESIVAGTALVIGDPWGKVFCASYPDHSEELCFCVFGKIAKIKIKTVAPRDIWSRLDEDLF